MQVASVLGILGALTLALHGGARAEGVPAAAQKLADQGAAALAAGDAATALQRYEQAYRQAPVPGLLRELGKVAQAQGRLIESADLYRRYLREAGEALDAAEREALQARIREVSQPTGEVAVQGEDGAVVRVDERVVGVLPLPLSLLLAAGQHTLRLEKERRKVETRLKVAPNRPVAVRFTLVPPVALVSLTRAAVLLPEWTGVPEAGRQRLVQAAVQGAAGERVLIIPEERVAAALPAPGAPKGPAVSAPNGPAAQGLAACAADGACQERLVAQLEARYLLRLRLAAEGEGLRLAVQVEDVAAGPGAPLEEVCTPCAAPQAARAVAGLVSRAVREIETRPRGEVAVTSLPPGAALSLDGRALGKTPQRRAAFTGEHEISLALPGYQPYQTRVTVANDEAAQVEARLVPVPPPPPPPKAPPKAPPIAARPAKTPFYRTWWFWGGVGLVAAGAVAGGVAGGLAAQNNDKFPNPRALDY